jgi:hypothetical protein
LIGKRTAEVNGHAISEDLIASAAQALGLVSAMPVPLEEFSALVVLSGLVRACVNRTRYAAYLVKNGVPARSVTVLSGHRQLSQPEQVQAAQLGLGEQFDEADVVLATTRQAFDLSEPQQLYESMPHPEAWDDALWSACAQYTWPDVQVLIAPSAAPDRRVNTVDQLRHWARETHISRDDRVLLLTTQIYVPYQQFGALQVLGIEYGCSVYCCGVDAASSYLPAAPFTGRSYLQEIRSALCAADRLLTAAQQAV